MVYNIIKKISETSSRNSKIQILTENKENEDLKRAIFLALDPFTQFYIRKIPDYNQYDQRDLEWAMNELRRLSEREVTGNAGVEHLRHILSSLDNSDDAEVIKRIIAKDLKCGIQAATVNKVWPGLIQEYPVMLCEQFDQKLVDKIKWPAYVQRKEDGMRFNAIVRNGHCEFRSRNGKEIDLKGYLSPEFKRMTSIQDSIVYDGELICFIDGKPLDRKTSNGILNKAIKGTISQEEANTVHAILWDMIPYSDFIKGKGEVPYSERFEIHLMNLFLPEKIHIVPSSLCKNMNEALEKFDNWLSQKFEGAVIKSRFGVWEDKRSQNLIKLKNELTCELRIKNIEEGTGKNVGRLGAFDCATEDIILMVNVGTGFSDDQRIKYFDQSLVDKVITVRYNEKIQDKNGKWSLFLPVFVEIREDKYEADNFGDIK